VRAGSEELLVMLKTTAGHNLNWFEGMHTVAISDNHLSFNSISKAEGGKQARWYP
jgi:hypothetical protein